MVVVAVNLGGTITDNWIAAGRMAPMLGCGVFTSVALATWDYTGGLAGIRPEIDGMDDLERREAIRKNRRRPIEETLAVIGEGRGKCFLYSLYWIGLAGIHGMSRANTPHRHPAAWLPRATEGTPRGEVRREDRASIGVG